MPTQLSTVLDVLVPIVLAGEIAAAALIDARERRFPHALSVLLAATAVMALLLATETLWRRMHGGAAGLGGGDVKFLAALMLADPLYALASFILGLCLLAVCGLLARRDALPLLPFVAIGCAFVPLAALLP